MFKPLFTASCKVWATQGTLSQSSSLDATVMLLALSYTSATMRPSEIHHSTHACLRQVAMFSSVCRLDISFVNSTFAFKFPLLVYPMDSQCCIWFRHLACSRISSEQTYGNCSSLSSCAFKLLYSLRQVEVIWGRDGTLYSGSRQYISLLKPVPSTVTIGRRSIAMNYVMASVISPDCWAELFLPVARVSKLFSTWFWLH